MGLSLGISLMSGVYVPPALPQLFYVASSVSVHRCFCLNGFDTM